MNWSFSFALISGHALDLAIVRSTPAYLCGFTDCSVGSRESSFRLRHTHVESLWFV
jgi:hypothetical protein